MSCVCLGFEFVVIVGEFSSTVPHCPRVPRWFKETKKELEPRVRDTSDSLHPTIMLENRYLTGLETGLGAGPLVKKVFCRQFIITAALNLLLVKLAIYQQRSM